MDEWTRTIIAGVIVIVGLGIIVWGWAFFNSTNAGTITTAMTGMIGVVLGYYFGSSGKDKADKAAADATTKADKATKDSVDESTRKKALAAQAIAKVARTQGRFQVVGPPGGVPQARIRKEGPPATPEEAAVSDLQDAVDQLIQV